MITIENMSEQHVIESARLFMSRYKEQHDATPLLDEAFVNEGAITECIRSTVNNYGGRVLLDGDRLLGYMTGFVWNGLLGPNLGALVPEWGHAAVKEDVFSIYRKLYQACSLDWTEKGVLTHAIAFLDTERTGQEAFLWSGFGYQCFDAIRPVARLWDDNHPMARKENIKIMPVTEELVPHWLPMVKELSLHLVRGPIFKGDIELPTDEGLKEELNEDGTKVFMAFLNDEPAGYIKISYGEQGAAWIVNGEKKIAVNGAYVYPKFRCRGVSALLLNEVMNWGVENGFVRCSVDFEPMNPEAYGFWLKYFKPVCRAMVRRLDSRILDWRST